MGILRMKTKSILVFGALTLIISAGSWLYGQGTCYCTITIEGQALQLRSQSKVESSQHCTDTCQDQVQEIIRSTGKKADANIIYRPTLKSF